MGGKNMNSSRASAALSLRCRSVLVLGGARSGKSRYARELAEAGAPARLFIATASVGDEEMTARIERHRAERSEGWTTLERPLDIVEALAAETREGQSVVVD